jgi:two-component system response regulator MprA
MRFGAEDFASAGHSVDMCTLSEAVHRASARTLDVLVVDLAAHPMAITRLRDDGVAAPIIAIVGKGGGRARAAALEAGADDVVSPPFTKLEFFARARALTRRSRCPRWIPIEPGVIRLRDDFVVEVDDLSVALPRRQFALLAYLLRRPNTIVTRREIHFDVFGYRFDPGTNTIDVHLLALRRKLENFPVRLETIRGEGIRAVVTRPTH